MSSYPAKMAVIVADVVIADGDPNSSNLRSYVFLNGFTVLKVQRQGRGFLFEEVRQVDEVGTASVQLLDALTSHLDSDASLAGYRLDRAIAALVRVPRDDPHDATAKPALQRLRASLANDVHDVAWHDLHRHRTLEQLAGDFDLPAHWHRPTRQTNPCMLERELSARAQTVWLSVAHACLSPDELRRAMADYDQWRTASSIA
jgi:hypothetical protein